MNGFESFDGIRTAIDAAPAVWAYLDPGTGSMLLQVLLAGVLSATFFLKTGFRHFRDLVWLKTRKS